MTHVTFPNLRRFTFEGDSDYLEAFLPWIITPLLEKLHIALFYRHIFPVPHVLKLLGSIESLRFANVKLKLCPWYIFVRVYHPRGVGGVFSLFQLERNSGTFSQQIVNAVRIVNSLGTLFSTVEHLTLQRGTSFGPMELGIDYDRTQWCMLLRPFRNVKTLLVDEGLTWETSRYLPFRHGEPPMDLLPELKELVYCRREDIVVDALTRSPNSLKPAGKQTALLPWSAISHPAVGYYSEWPGPAL